MVSSVINDIAEHNGDRQVWAAVVERAMLDLEYVCTQAISHVQLAVLCNEGLNCVYSKSTTLRLTSSLRNALLHR